MRSENVSKRYGFIIIVLTLIIGAFQNCAEDYDPTAYELPSLEVEPPIITFIGESQDLTSLMTPEPLTVRYESESDEVTLQWYRKRGNAEPVLLTGQVSNALEFSDGTTAYQARGTYTVKVTNAGGTTESAPITITYKDAVYTANCNGTILGYTYRGSAVKTINRSGETVYSEQYLYVFPSGNEGSFHKCRVAADADGILDLIGSTATGGARLTSPSLAECFSDTGGGGAQGRLELSENSIKVCAGSGNGNLTGCTTTASCTANWAEKP